MKKTPELLKFLVTAAALGAWSFASAQSIPAPTQVQAEIEDLKVVMQKTPEFSANTSDNKKDGKKKEWLELEIEFETKSDSRIGLIPELTVTYYVLVKGAAAGANGTTVLTDTFTYTNILDKEEQFAIVYVSPSKLTALTAKPDSFKESDVAMWGVEMLYNGRVVGEGSSGGKQWWNDPRAPGKTTGFLTPKEKTPFGLLWIDRHVETADK